MNSLPSDSKLDHESAATSAVSEPRPRPARPQPILQVADLTKSYNTEAGKLVVLKGVSLDLRVGDSCAIVGPSGSGKTTLLGLCAGLDDPTSGAVSWYGHPLINLSQDERAAMRNRHMGFVFQSFQLLPTLTALENVMVPLELRGERDRRRKALELLEVVGLGPRVGHYPSQLSGGEQQRVALARAFVHRPALLFADEPTGNLDAETSEPIVDMLFELNRESATALMLVTHDVTLARRADRMVRMRAGAVVEETGAAVDLS